MKHSNSRKDARIKNFPQDSVQTMIRNIEGLLSFNFKFLDQTQGQRLSELSSEQVDRFVDKLKWYSTETAMHWKSTRIGGGSNTVLSEYDSFPSRSEFHHPRFVPADVKWARFHMEGDMRLIGFLIDKKDGGNTSLNTDVFYVVFLDLYHKFYKSIR